MRDDIRGIALVGEPGSGKTSIAHELCKILGWEPLSFATALKNQVAAGLGHTVTGPTMAALDAWGDHIDAMNDPARKDTYRPLLQAWGSFWRAQDEDYWVNKLTREMESGKRYVVDDCRYNNEYNELKRRGFVFVYLQPGETTRYLTNEQWEHESERDWPHFDVDLYLGYVRGLRLQAEAIVRHLYLTENALDEPEFPVTNFRVWHDGRADGVCVGTEHFLITPAPVTSTICECGGYSFIGEEDHPVDCACEEEPENCDCDGCTDGKETVGELMGVINDTAVTILFDPPYTGRVTLEQMQRDVREVSAADEIVWAVPA